MDVTIGADGANVLILDACCTLLQATHGAGDGVEQVDRLGTSDDDRDFVALGQARRTEPSPSPPRPNLTQPPRPVELPTL